MWRISMNKHRGWVWSVGVAILLLVISGVMAQGADKSETLRTEKDRARDADRKPDEILNFFGISAGMPMTRHACRFSRNLN